MAIDTTLINIDFEVFKTNACKTLKVLDLSHWANGEPDLAYIQITTPGGVSPVTHVFQKGRLNIFNSNNLQLTDTTNYSILPAIPDGIYKITILQCQDDPNAATKYHFQDCQLRCQIKRKLISVDLTCNPCRDELMESMWKILMYLEGAQAQADECNVNKAMEYYRRASTLLDRISDSPNNNCKNC